MTTTFFFTSPVMSCMRQSTEEVASRRKFADAAGRRGSDRSAPRSRAAPGAELAHLAPEREASRVVEEALAKLPAEQRAVLLLQDVEGFAYEEIAIITSTEIGTVKSRIHRGRVAVRNILVSRGWKGSSG